MTVSRRDGSRPQMPWELFQKQALSFSHPLSHPRLMAESCTCCPGCPPGHSAEKGPRPAVDTRPGWL